MFGSLIRRKQNERPLGEDDVAFESTTFSLSTAVPRPSERRADERLIAMLRVAKLTGADGREQLIRVRNVSAGGSGSFRETRCPGPQSAARTRTGRPLSPRMRQAPVRHRSAATSATSLKTISRSLSPPRPPNLISFRGRRQTRETGF